MNSLNRMLDAAENGSFSESVFDESLLSSVEANMAKYLSSSEVYSKKLQEERDKIKVLISDISHQTKTPIANILLYSQLLSEQKLPEESRICVKALGQQAEKLTFLIDSLVKTSRLETGVLVLHPDYQSVQLLFNKVLDQAALKADKKKIKLTAEESDIYACFDLKWTAEALYNIVDNAIKYTANGGKIHIFAKKYELFVRIDVSDSGVGITEEEFPKIFGRFYRSPAVNDTEGVGIGLYLARYIIAGQGGYIKVSSKFGEGSTFSVYLPKAH